jgi:AraC-like DNA-binding protein
MQVTLHQILQCPYQGAIKQMYLEGKVLELAALQFAQFTEPNELAHSEPLLKQDDIDRLHHAKEILLTQFNHPPSILSLARQVGLNDFKLKQGFRQVFGTTVFGYLRDYRLEQARLLLLEKQMSVQQVARAIGYTHSGYFAKAFKQKFGVSPKIYQMIRHC